MRYNDRPANITMELCEPHLMSPQQPHTAPPDLENADIRWEDSGAPYSQRFGDIYFSREGGLEETRYVFLEANRLVERWQAADAAGEPVFTIAELGFGTGLNFLCTWQLWQQCAPRQLRLHYISCEKYPMQREALLQALASWPQLGCFSEALARSYPDHTPGCHRLHLRSIDGASEVTLDLYYGDAEQMLQEQLPTPGAPGSSAGVVDAWFLDGFAPRVNPGMWSEPIFAAIAGLSHSGTTLSTYSVAGQVVRGLTGQGFTVSKLPGYGHKREMLSAELPESPAPSATLRRPSAGQGHDKTAIIIGAGLAGCSSAARLASRGYQVTVLERGPDIAQGASGNRQGVLQCRMNRHVSAEWYYNLHSYLYASRYYDLLSQDQHCDFSWQRCGVLTLDSAYGNTRKKADQQTYAHYSSQVLQRLNARQASAVAGVELPEEAFFLPHGGWLDPAALCRTYVQHPLIRLQPDCEVARLQFKDEAWQACSARGEILGQAAIVIIANSFEACRLQQTSDLPLRPLRGQLSYLPQNDASSALRSVVCARSYMAPAHGGTHCIGASYVKNSTDTQLSDEEHLQNLYGIAEHIPALQVEAGRTEAGRLVGGRASIRGGSLDFMPMVGPLADSEDAGINGERLAGLYVNAGHGSHGLATTPLAAEYLASLIAGEALPLQQAVAACVDPARFQRRASRKAGRIRSNSFNNPRSNPR